MQFQSRTILAAKQSTTTTSMSHGKKGECKMMHNPRLQKSVNFGLPFVILATFALSAHANLVSNGSFETTTLTTTGSMGTSAASVVLRS